MPGDGREEELRETREKVREEKEKVRQEVEESARAASLELSSFDQHPADLASDLFLREQMQGVYELLDRREERLDQALQREDRGICVRCGRTIERERLKILPETDLCARCARELAEKGP